MTLHLTRQPSTPSGTFGVLTDFCDVEFYSLEKPWVDGDGNGHGDPQKSCIDPPPGQTTTYTCEWRESPAHGWCYEVTNVPGRSHILIHSANWQEQLLGCIALGKGRGMLNGKPAITQSRAAIEEFNNRMGKLPFQLTVSWAASS